MNILIIQHLNKQKKISLKGAIFCHVKIKKQESQFVPSIILINQLWKGAAAIFNIRDKIIIKLINKKLCSLFRVKLYSEFKIVENKNIFEPIVWIKKYLSIDSFSIEFMLFERIGMKDKRLISNPSHALKIELEEIARVVPKNDEKINKIVKFLNTKNIR